MKPLKIPPFFFFSVLAVAPSDTVGDPGLPMTLNAPKNEESSLTMAKRHFSVQFSVLKGKKKRFPLFSCPQLASFKGWNFRASVAWHLERRLQRRLSCCGLLPYLSSLLNYTGFDDNNCKKSLVDWEREIVVQKCKQLDAERLSKCLFKPLLNLNMFLARNIKQWKPLSILLSPLLKETKKID